MSEVIHAKTADSPGYTRITLDEPVGSVQAGVVVKSISGEVEQEIIAHGQRELDVLEGATVTFPDGSTWADA